VLAVHIADNCLHMFSRLEDGPGRLNGITFFLLDSLRIADNRDERILEIVNNCRDSLTNAFEDRSSSRLVGKILQLFYTLLVDELDNIGCSGPG